MKKPVILNCIICKKSFRIRPYLLGKAKFCSLDCYGISRKGISGGMLGKKHSKESKRKMSEARLKNPPTYWIGRKFTLEHRKKLSISLKGHKAPKTAFKKNHISWNNGKKVPQTTGIKNVNWKGDNVGYMALHSWVRRHNGNPKKCKTCGSIIRVQWANKSHEYKRDLSDWIELCQNCHFLYDRKMGWGDAFTKFPSIRGNYVK